MPAFEIDHLFICTSIGACEAERLVEFGLVEGTPNVHPGQGTANRRFFFRNAMLELLWVHDAVEAQSETTRATRLWERWAGRSNGTCPLGLCFRPVAAHVGELPFPAWEYRPKYLPSPLCIHVATNSHKLSEPMLVYLAFGQRGDMHQKLKRESFQHAAGLSELTRVEIVSPCAGNPSPQLQALSRDNLVKLRQGPAYLLELGFDGESQRKQKDFRPTLPLVFHW